MSEKQYREIEPNGELKPVKVSITGASNHSLEVLGKPHQPLNLTFFNAEDRKQGTRLIKEQKIVAKTTAS